MVPSGRMGAPPPDARVVRTHEDVLASAWEALVGQGWELVTHQRVADAAGYSRATIYAHWPTRTALLRGALGRVPAASRAATTGDLRADLLAALMALRRDVAEHRLDRVLAVLADLGATDPGLAGMRERLVRDRERPVRELLAGTLDGPALEAGTVLLCGAVLHPALLHGRPPDDEVLAAAVDLVVAGR